MYRFPFHWTLLPAAVASIVISVAISVAGRSLSAEPPAAVVTDEKAARPRQIATPQTDQTTKKAQEPAALKSVPDRLVVLTFDDASASHFHIVRPLLKKYGFGATFFITEGFDFPSNKRDYLTWKQIAQLHQDGFEIGNHTRDHLSITEKNLDSIAEQLEAINRKCRQHQIPAPTSFAYPGNATSTKALAILKQHGIRFARRGGMPEYPYRQGRGFAYQPGLDHPLLIPSAGDARPDWELADLIRAARQARYGRIAVLQFHGVPDTAHSWVSTTADKFEGYLRYLAKERYTVIAMRDLAKYVNPEIVSPPDRVPAVRSRVR